MPDTLKDYFAGEALKLLASDECFRLLCKDILAMEAAEKAPRIECIGKVVSKAAFCIARHMVTESQGP